MASKNIPVDLIDGEEWRDTEIHGVRVSNLGRVMRVGGTAKRMLTDRLFSLQVNENGYVIVMVGGKAHRVHRLVAVAFLAPDLSRPFVNHIDGSKTNNIPANLEWVTRAENMAHAARTGLMRSGIRHGMAKLTDEQVAEIHTLFADGHSGRQVADRFGITRSYAYHIKAGLERAA